MNSKANIAIQINIIRDSSDAGPLKPHGDV